MLSKWHVHAEGYANEVNRSGKAQVAAVWDEDKNAAPNGPAGSESTSLSVSTNFLQEKISTP